VLRSASGRNGSGIRLSGDGPRFGLPSALGRTPQPALARIRLAEGKVKAAATAINAAVAEETWDQWARVRLLPAQVEIAIAADALAGARSAAEELTRIVDTYQSPALDAGKHQAWGRVLLAEGDVNGAVRELRSAIRDWREAAVPYEVAGAQAVLARALRALGDDESADLELDTAHSEFERLGANPDAAAAEREIRQAARWGVLDGVTTNPTLFSKIKGKTYDEVLQEICAINKGPVSAEVVADDVDGMLKEGDALPSVRSVAAEDVLSENA